MPDNKIQNVDLSALNGLSPEERKLAIEMLKEIADTGNNRNVTVNWKSEMQPVPTIPGQTS